MLHLIWQKDNNTTSDDGAQIKGVRQGLLDCYNALYFEPVAGMEPRQQINRIAKNMIESVESLIPMHHALTVTTG
jgi:condensin complex subunit 1